MKRVTPDKKKLEQLWSNMNTRCYNDNYHEERPSYTECTICDEWLDEETGKQNFFDWCCENFYVIDGEDTVQLDKDILIKGNKVYSPDTCIFAPKKINDMFGGSSKKSDNDLPKGVSRSKKTGKYKPLVYVEGRQVNVGMYDTPEKAWEVYACHRKCAIIAMADKYKGLIPDALYQAMMNWEISIDD